jgi:hypothetical protein
MNNVSIIIFCVIICWVISCDDLRNDENMDIQSLRNENAIINSKKSKIPIYQCDYLNQEPPGSIPKLFSPNFVSTKEEHSAVMITPDGNEMWFGRMYPPQIWHITKINDTWSEIRLASFIENFHYLYPILSPDGNKIYFTSNKPVTPGGPKLPRSEGDIWYCERNDIGWSEPIHLGNEINFGNRHAVGSFSNSGNLYYTVRTGKGNNKQTDIYFAKYEYNFFSTPTKIDELNCDQPSHCPFVAPDESYIIFSSFRGGVGMSDLFISFRDSLGNWMPPKNLGLKINSSAKDEYPFITPDGQYLFFNSSRISEINDTRIQDGPGNMFWVRADFIEEMRKKI